MPSRVQMYLAHLDGLTGAIEPRFTPVGDPAEQRLPRMVSITYRDLPEPGILTGFTYGLSLASHPDWVHGKPELCISVRSDDEVWAVAVTSLADQLRGECPFSYGNTLDFNERITATSPMTAFAVFAPAVLEPADHTNIDVGDTLINIVGIYPIHEVERQYIRQNGLRVFWERDWDPYDVTRAPAV